MNDKQLINEQLPTKLPRMPSDEGVTYHERLAKIVANQQKKKDSKRRIAQFVEDNESAEELHSHNEVGGNVSSDLFDD